METPERIGKAAGDIFAALVVVSVLTLVLNMTLGFMLQ
jgi:hypothetical protein